MATSRMEFDVSLSRPVRPREDGEPLRILVIADLGGARDGPLAQRRPLPVDIDNLDAVLARLAPCLVIELDGLPLELHFESLDDFHPDRLHDRLAPFEVLRRLRSELDDPARLGRVAASLGVGLAPPAAAPQGGAPDPAAADVERLLGRKPSGQATVAARGGVPALDDWLRQLVAPYVKPSVAQEQQMLRAAVDDALGALMRRLLRHPALQALEATWRGVERLVRGLDLDESMQLHLLDASRIDLADDVAAHRDDLSASGLHRLLHPGAAGEGRAWGLVVLDQAFGAEAGDVTLLASLGALCARAGSPLLAAAGPTLAGADDAATLAEPRRCRPADDPSLATWQALRTSPIAPWIGLVLPRLLMRLPYGAATDRIERFAFEEMPTPDPAAYLWGLGPMALAGLAAQAWDAEAGGFALDDARDLDDLPAHVATVDGDRRLQPVAEVLLNDVAVEAIMERGLMPLVARRDRAQARLWRWSSIAEPAQALRGLEA